MNKKNIKYLLLLTITIVIFIYLFNNLTNNVYKYVAILSLLPISLMFSQKNRKFVWIFICLAIIYSIVSFKLTTLTLITILSFLSLIPLLFYFFKPTILKDPAQQKKNKELSFYKEELMNEEEYLKQENETLKKKLDKITDFYIISKDLIKSFTEAKTAADSLSNILSKRQGVESVVIVVKQYDEQNIKKFQIITKIDKVTKQKWNKIIKHNIEIENLKSSLVVNSLFNINNKPVVAWPIVIDNSLIACIFLVVKPEYVQSIIEDGTFFLPHLQLGTKRIMLFTELRNKSRIDGLTNTYLRRHFMEKMHIEVQRAKRYSTNFHIMMIDIDFFKKVNDTYGHLVGDIVLKEVSNIIKNNIRPGDIICRYGGEEFIVLINMLMQNKVVEMAEKIRQDMQNFKFTHNNKTFNVTVSIGISQYNSNVDTDTLISQADQALYKAKQTGRNKVINYFELT